MDGSNNEHSDSDSGESWSLVEHIPSYGDDVPEFPESTPSDRDAADATVEKDDDTDGISIISDSDPEPSMPFEPNYKSNTDCEVPPPSLPQYVTINPPNPASNELHESMRNEDDFLGDNAKHKTYVHRRNKRLSTVLNIIVLGSVITAAGVAIGHMWGARNDCTINTTPSVNKILSNLYKLQEENAYLRGKIKELAMINNLQTRKSATENVYKPQNKCKKVFEDSLNSVSEKPTKCVDHSDIPRMLDVHMMETDHGKDFLRDINKLKHIYKQNKSWLDEEVTKRLHDEELSIKRMKNIKNKLTKENSEATQLNGEHFGSLLEPIIESTTDTLTNSVDPIIPITAEDKKSSFERKISYADSLKSNQIPNKEQQKEYVRVGNNIKDFNKKKVTNKDVDTLSTLSVSEDEFKKDDRYIEIKHKPERKKHDRKKTHKKQKRKNKYEQWEMKGGYLKDYDDFSISSSQENEYVLKNPDNNFLAKNFEQDNYINQFIEKHNIIESGKDDAINKRKGEFPFATVNKDTWYEKRAVLRNEARKKLEHELFGDTSPNNAGWYFRRMQRREQCRAKGENSTYRKLSKRNMNFKMKH